MLTLRVLGPDLPDVATTYPLTYSGLHRQNWDRHITVGALDITPGSGFGYDWECVVIAYKEWAPGRHGTSCPPCDERIERGIVAACPAGENCGHLRDGEEYSATWGAVRVARFDVRTSADHRAGRRFDAARLAAAIAAADATLIALPDSSLPWTAYGPAHPYGHWATEQEARAWLIGHMHRLVHDRNLGEQRQRAAAGAADRLAAGSDRVQIGAKIYGIRARWRHEADRHGQCHDRPSPLTQEPHDDHEI